jgi:hypothetical protein
MRDAVGTSEGPCEEGNESTRYIKDGEFVEYPRGVIRFYGRTLLQ